MDNIHIKTFNEFTSIMESRQRTNPPKKIRNIASKLGLDIKPHIEGRSSWMLDTNYIDINYHGKGNVGVEPGWEVVLKSGKRIHLGDGNEREIIDKLSKYLVPGTVKNVADELGMQFEKSSIEGGWEIPSKNVNIQYYSRTGGFDNREWFISKRGKRTKDEEYAGTDEKMVLDLIRRLK